jgi:hypothetical protein
MMNRFIFVPLAVMLVSGCFALSGCSDPMAPPTQIVGGVTELVLTDIKLGEGAEAKANSSDSIPI